MKQIVLENAIGIFATIDDDDYELVNKFKWILRIKGKKSYAVTGGKSVRLHRLLLNNPDKSLLVDHINGNGLDNRRENLRVCNNAQNLRNRGKNNNNKGRYKGVSLRTGKNTYIARIMTDEGKYKYLGDFLTDHDAALAYNKAAIQYHGEFAYLNIIVDPAGV